MRSSEKVRLVVFFVFTIALIIFGSVYQPVDALSHPANQEKLSIPSGAPLAHESAVGLGTAKARHPIGHARNRRLVAR
jgi:hypothetical protein